MFFHMASYKLLFAKVSLSVAKCQKYWAPSDNQTHYQWSASCSENKAYISKEKKEKQEIFWYKEWLILMAFQSV